MGKRIGWLAGIVAGGAAVLAACGGGSAPSVAPNNVSAGPPPVITSLTAAATHLLAAQPTQISWASTGADNCSIDQGVGTVDCNGSATVVPGTTTTYTLTATNPGGSTTRTVNITAGEPGRFVFTTSSTANMVGNFSVDAATEDLTSLATPAPTGSTPWGSVLDPTGSILYVTVWGADVVASYGIDRTTGAVAAIGTVPAGDAPRQIVIDPAGRNAYVLNQGATPGNGTLSAYAIGASGQLNAIGVPITLGNQPTGLAIDGLGRYVYVGTPLSNTVSMFSINADGTLASLGNMTVTQPIELAAHPNGRFIYASNRVAGTVTALTVGADGRLTALAPVAGTGTMTPLVVEARGRFLYAADSNNNFLHMYAIDQSTGQLTSLGGGLATSGGPNALTTDAQGKYLYLACAAGTVQVWRIDQASGLLTLVRTVASAGILRSVVVAR